MASEDIDRPAHAKWRSKWKRTDPQRRGGAAGSLADVFASRRRRGWILAALLVMSLAGHVAGLAFVRPREGQLAEASAAEDGYLAKVMQKERAKDVSKKMVGQLTMPPPPPDPEAVVNTVLSDEISTNINRVVGDLLDVKVTGDLAAKVTASLMDELAAAAKNIAEGKLSEREIKALQDQFKTKAHERTVQALQQYREDTQVAHAQLSVTDWYDQEISTTLRARLKEELFTRGAWGGHFNRQGWGYIWYWDGELSRFTRILGETRRLNEGAFIDRYRGQAGGKPIGHGWQQLPDWPAPTAKGAEALLMVLGGLYRGDAAPEAEPEWLARFAHYVRSFHAGQAEKLLTDLKPKIAAQWDAAFTAASEFQQLVEAGAAADKSTAARDRSLAAVKAAGDLAGSVILKNEDCRPLIAVNQAVFSRVLRGPDREKMYEKFVTALLDTLDPAVRDLADTQFREGILIREEGMDDTVEKFSQKILALLRQDIEAVVPKPQFDVMVFQGGFCPYKSQIDGRQREPSDEDIAADEAAFAAAVAKQPELTAYADGRAKLIAEEFGKAIETVTAELLDRITDSGRLSTRFYASITSVDYGDKVQQRLNARKAALSGRGQDMASLTEDGLPDPAASSVALLFGASKGQGASLEPVMTSMTPAMFEALSPQSALRTAAPIYPPPPAPWTRQTQPEVKPEFETSRCEGIPFLANFPSLDGDLTDWGRIRPLTLHKRKEPVTADSMVLYAAWNYQGFFFGYRAVQPDHRYYFPEKPLGTHGPPVLGLPPEPAAKFGNRALGWAYVGDHLRLMLDTLDSRDDLRGDGHTQEFVIFPRGTESDPNLPGVERTFASKRDARTRVGMHGWDGLKAGVTVFPSQPPLDLGPDGTGPYRVTRFEKAGYTMEAFLPRNLLNVPVFAPGWYIGFDAMVGMGYQHSGDWRGHMFVGQVWADSRGNPDRPSTWGDLLLLGTDARVTVQDAQPGWPLSRAIVPGHSYLVTVADPDRNVNLTAEDTVLVSAEVIQGDGQPGDVEVFVLKETAPNSSVFRGFINTQPGYGRQVQGVVEVLGGQQVRLGYVDFANAAGKRNVVYQVRLPVSAGVASVANLASAR